MKVLETQLPRPIPKLPFFLQTIPAQTIMEKHLQKLRIRVGSIHARNMDRFAGRKEGALKAPVSAYTEIYIR